MISSLAYEQTVQLSITSANALSAAPILTAIIFMDIRSPFPYQATVGIDWADQKHEVFVRFANGGFLSAKDRLSTRGHPGVAFGVAIRLRRGKDRHRS